MEAVEDTAGRLTVDLEEADGRYHRQSLITWWRQDLLANARVLVVGAGALGNELVKNLALAGVGTVVVVDLDRVENSNLSRCVFFRPEDEGRFKAEVVCSRAAEVNDEITLIPVVGDVRHVIGLGDYRDFDVVLGGLDNREARLHVNQACWKAGTPWVDGAIEGLMGTMRVFVPPDSACYECTMSPRDHQLLAARKACALLTREQMLAGHVPTTGTSGSVVAAMQVQELIKLLHADEVPYEFGGKGFAFNGMTHDSYPVTYPRRDDCLSHDTYALTDAVRVPADRSFGEILEQSREAFPDGVAPAIDLEHEIVLRGVCSACGEERDFRRPLTMLHTGDGDCPSCGEEWRLDAVHALEGEELLALTPADLQLPANDVVTVRWEDERVHVLVGDPLLDSHSEDA